MCVCVKSLCKQKQTSSPKNKSLKKSDQFIFPFLLLQPFLDSLHGFDMSNATTVQITHSIKVGGLLTCRGLAPVHWFPTVKEGWYMPMGHHHERNRRLGIWWQIPPPKKKNDRNTEEAWKDCTKETCWHKVTLNEILQIQIL